MSQAPLKVPDYLPHRGVSYQFLKNYCRIRFEKKLLSMDQNTENKIALYCDSTICKDDFQNIPNSEKVISLDFELMDTRADAENVHKIRGKC